METTSYYTPNCMLFKKAFQGIPNVTTFESEFIDGNRYHDFDGAVYINHREFISVYEFESGKYMVYINNPLWGDDDEQHDIPEHQWVFGYYKSLKRAINRALAITKQGFYPKPLEIH